MNRIIPRQHRSPRRSSAEGQEPNRKGRPVSHITPFEFEGHALRFTESGDIVAADLAKALGYSSAKDMTRTLDDSWCGGRFLSGSAGGASTANISQPKAAKPGRSQRVRSGRTRPPRHLHKVAGRRLCLEGTSSGGNGMMTSVILAYFDESGDSGQKGGSATYTLGGVLIDADQWADSFDKAVALRRELRDEYGLLLRHEVKANSLIRGSGDLTKLNLTPDQRHDIWVRHLRLLEDVGARVYAVVIRKEAIHTWRNPQETAWEYALQRLERVTTQEKDTCMVIHDEGDNLGVRSIFRRARRVNRPGSAFGDTHLPNMPSRRILDDPVPRNSTGSYFIQMADLVAYAGYRTVVPPSAGPGRVCPGAIWDELGDARWSNANQVARGARARPDRPGVVVWPKQ